MASFVLVHGSGQNAASWGRVGRRLRERGHEVVAPELPKREGDWGLEEHAGKIAEAVTGSGDVVVAHSLCGALLPLVPRRRECSLLVFLAAVIPEPGKSVRDQLAEDPTMFNPDWIAAGARWFDDTQVEGLAREFLFHDGDEAAIVEGLGTIERIDSRNVITQRCPLDEWPSVPAVSIVARDDRTLAPDWIRRRTRRVLGGDAIEIPGGHCPQTTRPIELADLLDRLVTTGAC